MTLEDEFRATFGTAPQATASVPGRVNLIGEHTDYNGGAVLPAAIDRRVHIALTATDAPQVVIRSTRFDEAIERPTGDPKRGDWTDYAMGALTLASENGWISSGAQLYIDSDVPDGAGVSSSAALITAILRAAVELGDATVSPVDIVQQARKVENEYIGMPCGIMDQMAVGLADSGSALALDTSTLDYEVIDIPENWAFITIHSGVRRELADGRYKRRFEECQEAADQLGADELCRLDSDQIKAMSNLPEALLKRTRHVVSEHQRTVLASAAMKNQDMATFARLMTESHASYSQDFEASTSVIDALVEDAVASGAQAARLTGGGFGGCIVALVEASESEAWVEGFLARHKQAWRV